MSTFTVFLTNHLRSLHQSNHVVPWLRPNPAAYVSHLSIDWSNWLTSTDLWESASSTHDSSTRNVPHISGWTGVRVDRFACIRLHINMHTYVQALRVWINIPTRHSMFHLKSTCVLLVWYMDFTSRCCVHRSKWVNTRINSVSFLEWLQGFEMSRLIWAHHWLTENIRQFLFVVHFKP